MSKAGLTGLLLLAAGTAQAAVLTEESCSVLITRPGDEKPFIQEAPGLSVMKLRPDSPLRLRAEDGVKINAIMCWRSEARLAEHDDLVADAGFPLYVKAEFEDESRNRTLVLERVGGRFRARLVSGSPLTEGEQTEVRQFLALYEARDEDRSSAAASARPTDATPPPPNAPVDRPQRVTGDELRKYERAIAPYVAEARKTWPDAKRRYLAGLPEGHIFFVVTRLKEGEGRWESAFIQVESIKEGMISGTISTHLRLIQTHKFGDAYSFREDELVDWGIARPDGSEEGNVVGKFLDTYEP